MDRHPPEPQRNDPLITVEAVPVGVEREPGWTHARRAAAKRAAKPAAEPGRCRHRVRWRNLKTSWKILFALAAPLVVGSALVAFFGLFCTVVLASIGVGDPDPQALFLAPLTAAISVQLLAGFGACHRTWNKLHRPGLPVCVSSMVVPLPILSITAIEASAFSMPWLMLLVVPPLAPMLVLLYFRSALYPLATCTDFPWLPPKIFAMLQPRTGRRTA